MHALCITVTAGVVLKCHARAVFNTALCRFDRSLDVVFTELQLVELQSIELFIWRYDTICRHCSSH
jgi:hypothetical protein